MKPTKQQAQAEYAKRNTRSSARSGKRSTPAVNGAAPKPKAATPRTAKPSIPVTPRALALARLHVTQEQLDRAPDITTTLKNATDGGMPRVFSAMRFSQDETIAAFLDKYDALPLTDRKTVPLEAVGLAAGLNLNTLLGSITLALTAHAGNSVKILLTTNQPRITRARIKNGQLPGGYRDRDAIEYANGTLPQPNKAGGIFINNKAIFGTGTTAMNEQRAIGAGSRNDDDEIDATDPGDYDLDRLFPPAVATQERLVPIRNRQITAGEGKRSYWTDEEREAYRAEMHRVDAETHRQVDALTGAQTGTLPARRDEDKDKN